MSHRKAPERPPARMPLVADLRRLFRLADSGGIARRYLVTNGLDASLAMLGLMMGFRSADRPQAAVALTACFGTAVAFGVSSFTSTYVSESAERQKELDELEAAMLHDLSASAHRRAVVWVPIMTAAISALSPFLAAQIIMAPLWAARNWSAISGPAVFDAGIALAFVVVFTLGAGLGRIRGGRLLTSALQTVAVAIVTAVVIALVAP